MVYIYYTLILSILLFVQNIQSFCVYNQFTDGSSIEVTQIIRSTPVERRFRKTINAEGSECCSFKVQDCSPRQQDDDPTSFYVFFHWPRYNTERHSVICTTGGVLVFKGDESNHWAECTTAWGMVSRPHIVPDAQMS